jgi:arsenate reductase
MITIYHNPRCQKSREALALLQEKGVQYSIRLYLNDEESMSAAEFEDVLDALDMDAIDLVRKNESVWKEEYKTLELDEDEIILAMIENPKLMERPIVVNGASSRKAFRSTVEKNAGTKKADPMGRLFLYPVCRNYSAVSSSL